MWSHVVDAIIVDDDDAFAKNLTGELEPAGFKTRIANSLHEACSLVEGAACDILVVGFNNSSDVNADFYRSVMDRLAGTHLTALVPEESEFYERLLRDVGFHLVLPRELPPGRLAQFLTSQGEILELKRQNYRLRQMLDAPTTYETLIGGSAPMRSLYRLIDQLARTDAPVLAIGEPGTERIEVARSIHRKSTRGAHPLIVVDCVNGEQDEEGSFLFGPLGEGEFATGPCPTHSAFAKASNGTVVLHRVECLRQVAQRRLLDFMRRPFYQGETANCPQPLSRLMTTTHPDLKKQVEDGGFMRELFYRINILQARVPSLRERREDIPMLAQHFLDENNGAPDGEGPSGPGLSLSSRAWLHLFQYDWPENVDELSDLMRSLAQSAQGDQIEVDDLPEAVRDAGQPPPELRADEHYDMPLKEAKRMFESEYFKGLLTRTQGNMTLASRHSRVGRPYLYKKIREYGLEPDSFR